jgi:hypothetical protein
MASKAVVDEFAYILLRATEERGYESGYMHVSRGIEDQCSHDGQAIKWIDRKDERVKNR